MSKFIAWTTMLVLLVISAAARAEDYTLTLKDHQFSPAELTIPAGQKVKIIVRNMDATAAEFESFDLNREKVVSPQGEIVLFIGPLEPGKYTYFDEFHSDTAKGVIISK